MGPIIIIFNSAIFGFGLLLIAAAYLLRTVGTERWFLVLLTLTGLGAARVGIFPEPIIIPHTIGTITVFV